VPARWITTICSDYLPLDLGIYLWGMKWIATLVKKKGETMTTYGVFSLECLLKR
jgi:hypothetical protein